jgi:hypothetical protein
MVSKPDILLDLKRLTKKVLIFFVVKRITGNENDISKRDSFKRLNFIPIRFEPNINIVKIPTPSGNERPILTKTLLFGPIKRINGKPKPSVISKKNIREITIV